MTSVSWKILSDSFRCRMDVEYSLVYFEACQNIICKDKNKRLLSVALRTFGGLQRIHLE